MPKFKLATSIAAAFAATLYTASMSHAADLLFKAPPQIANAQAYAPCAVATASTPLSCSGFYVGAGIGGAGSNADILGNGINGSVFAGGITPVGVTGYQYVQGNWIFGAELDVGYAVNTNAAVNGLGNSFNGFRITQDFKAGGNLSGLLGTQVPITIPPQLANSVLGAYVHVGATQWQVPGAWAAGNVSGAGVLFDIGPRTFGDIRYSYTNFSGAKAGGVQINNDQSLQVTLSYKLN